MESSTISQEFAGVKGVPQFPTSDGQAPIASISYTEEFAELMGLFRYVVQEEEVSERAYRLTTEVLGVNPGNYTVWHWRRRCLDKLELSLERELEWLDDVGVENEKCYQYWHHRRLMLEKLAKPYQAEEAFFAEILESDSKNYHAWTYRQWYLAHYELCEAQLPVSAELIASNVLNNTFWTFRYFLVARSLDSTPDTKEKQTILKREIRFALQHVLERPTNEASWAYLRGFLKHSPSPNPRLDARSLLFSAVPEVEQRVRELADNRFALATLADIALESGRPLEAAACYDKLALSDPVRKNYYLWKKGRLSAKRDELSEQGEKKEEAKAEETKEK